jgi:hypothetical protein
MHSNNRAGYPQPDPEYQRWMYRWALAGLLWAGTIGEVVLALVAAWPPSFLLWAEVFLLAAAPLVISPALHRHARAVRLVT